ncbi:MAG: acyl-CoA thioesterase [Planctomycetaceae bacterium]|nr:acyl-CoA thioesterase [Planctomycetaceae bacterium]
MANSAASEPVKHLEMTVLMTPDKANFTGNVHGGEMMKMLDEVAFACASRYSGHYCVTLAVDQVVFKQPVHVGELVTFLAKVNFTGRTSMEVGIKVIAEDIKARTCRHTNSCYFTMVAIGEDGEPTEVPSVRLETVADHHHHEAAKRRRAFRREIQERNWTIKDPTRKDDANLPNSEPE